MALSSMAQQRTQSSRALLGSARGRHVAVAPARRAACRAVQVQARLTARPIPKWHDVFVYLKDKQLPTVTPEQAQEMLDSGDWVLVDVRPAPEFEKAHPAAAVSVPLYQGMDYSNLDAVKVLKTIAYTFNGVTPMEPNPSFSEELRKAAAGGKGVLTMCEAGGTMTPSTNFPEGKASRSLQAAYRALTEGVTDKVAHVERGVYGWYQADLDFVGEYAPDLGRTPMAAAEPTLKSINQSRGYEMKESDKVVEQQKKWPWG